MIAESVTGAAAVSRRRPSGEPPPLPRPVNTTTRLCGALVLAGAALSIALATDPGVRAVTQIDLAVLDAAERVRGDALTDAAGAVIAAGSTTTFRVLAWVVLGVLLVTRRFQHLFAAFALLLSVPLVLAGLREVLGRMRPAGVEIIGRWEGYAYPSRPVTEITLVLTLAVLVLVPSGTGRRLAARVAVALLALLVAARLYAAVDHPSDALAGLALGGALPVVAIRLLTPEEAFPVSYRRGVRAHLDLGGRRGEAIGRAFARQLGVAVSGVRPFGWGGSAGSTPLYVETTTGDDLFAKLYAAVHLRSDRWYKLVRTVRYGRLEDERPFNSVRRLVQYEDHMLRVVRDAGIRTPAPLGILEITPEREYLLVTALVPGAVHIDDADVTVEVVDAALAIVRRLWDAGLAHRDIKPSNLLVVDTKVWLIDVAFAEIRPSPWRQAADLANMMLTLALSVPTEQVYERALMIFTPDDVAEAFAASRAVTTPAQLRSLLRERADDPTGNFRRLAPARPPIAIQRWTLRRFGLTLAVAVALLVGLAALLANLSLAGLL